MARNVFHAQHLELVQSGLGGIKRETSISALIRLRREHQLRSIREKGLHSSYAFPCHTDELYFHPPTAAEGQKLLTCYGKLVEKTRGRPR